LAVTDNPGALIVARLLVGVFEAGFYSTAVAYLASFYSRYDLGVRLALFYGQYSIANAFSGLLCKISLIPVVVSCASSAECGLRLTNT
jgi:MFS family permease